MVKKTVTMTLTKYENGTIELKGPPLSKKQLAWRLAHGGEQDV